MYLYATGVYSSGEELHYKFTLAFKERNCPKKTSLGSLEFSSACTIASSFSVVLSQQEEWSALHPYIL